MNSENPAKAGRVASLHLHPARGGGEMRAVQEIQAVQDKGIAGEPRYFGRASRSGGPSRRQVSLIERETIAAHVDTLGLPGLDPGEVRSNIETEGIDLVALVGKEVAVGSAILYFSEPRDPCQKMDDLAPGLRAAMENGKQGVIAQVRQSGQIKVGDSIVAR